MAGGYFIDVLLHSSRNYHQERATELRRLSKDVAVAFGALILCFHGVPFCSNSNLWYLRIGTTKELLYECEMCGYVGWSLSIVDITEAKEMCSVLVSRSKVLRLVVADWHWKCGV